MNIELGRADQVIVVGFFVVMLAIGIYFASRMRSMKDYFSGGRQVPWWLSGTSLYMSSFSAWSFVAYSELSYKYGMTALTLQWTVVPAMLISAYWFASRWRRAATTSPLEFIEERYGPGLRQGLSWLGVPLTVIDDALKLVAIGTLVSFSLGIRLPHVILGCGLLMLMYTFLGGLWAVLLTDFVQFIVMAAAVVALIPLAWRRVGGLGRFVEQAPEGFFSLTSSEHSPFMIFTFLVIIVLGAITRWSYVQRFYAVRTDADARKVGYLVAALSLIGPPLLFFPAMASRLFLPEVEDTTKVYALLCADLLPVGMMGLVIAALFSATMSMLSSDYNAVASVITNDVYKRIIAPDASERSLVLVGRLATLAVGLVAVGIAVMMAVAGERGDLFNVMAKLFAVLLPPIAIPMIAGLTTKRVSNTGGIASFSVGAALGIGAYFLGGLESLAFLRKMECMTWLTTGGALIGLIAGTLASRGNREERARVGAFVDMLRSPEAQQEPSEPAGSALSPLPVIAASTIALGLLVIAVVGLTAPLDQAAMAITTGAGMALFGVACLIRQRVSSARRAS